MEHNVLRFKVPMSDTAVMYVGKPQHNFLNNLGHLDFCVVCIMANDVL
jgi:hypothetical protein